MNIVTGPSFFGGLLYGVNQRMTSEYKQDPYAHYKLLSLTSAMGFLKIVGGGNIPEKIHPLPHLFGVGLIGSILTSGTMFCMGMMMTKIPGPIFPDQGDKKEGVKIKLF